MFRRFLIAAVVFLALAVSATAVLPAAAKTSKAVGTHKLIVAVKKNMAPAAETKLAVLVLLSQNGGPRAGGLATPSKPLTVLQENSGLYRVKAEIDSSCKGSCDASYRISGAANHKLEVVPSCQPKGSGSSVARSRSSRSTNTGGSVGGHSRTLAQRSRCSASLHKAGQRFFRRGWWCRRQVRRATRIGAEHVVLQEPGGHCVSCVIVCMTR